MNVATHVGDVLVRLGVDHVFGLVGSGNFHLTNALIAAGARFVPATDPGAAATMADAYARVSGRVGVVSVHQGPGVTGALTGIAEAAKSRTPLIVLAPETAPASPSHIDLQGAAYAVGAEFHRVHAATTTEDVMTAWRLATFGLGGTVVLALPLAEQAAEAIVTPVEAVEVSVAADPDEAPLAALARALVQAQRPVFIAGRGAARVPTDLARSALIRLADRCGALLATSMAAKGLFAGEPWDIDVAGALSSPLAAALIADADVIIAWGASLDPWTTRNGTLIRKDATVIRVDHDLAALDRPLAGTEADDITVRGDVRRVAELTLDRLMGRTGPGWRTVELADRIRAGRWRDVPYQETPVEGRMDARTLTIALDDMLPRQRIVSTDSGNFVGYPAMFLTPPDPAGFCFTQAYQSVGLGLTTAIGAALARPDRLSVASIGDAGFLMSVAELTTLERLRLPIVIIVYNDSAHGAETHRFGPDGHPLHTVRFPEAHIAAIATGFGCVGVTVRTPHDLRGVSEWLNGPRDRPLVIDAKIAAREPAWWLPDAPPDY